MSVVALIPAAGRGTRLGAAVPKAFVAVAGESMLTRAVATMRLALVDHVVLIVPPELVADTAAQHGGDALVTVVAGGAERTDSVRAGLQGIPDSAADIVLVHDAARPLTPVALVQRVISAVQAGADAVVPVLPVVDTVKAVDESGTVTATVDRSALRAVQTPQGFRREVLLRAYGLDQDGATDDAGLVERAGGTVTTVPGDALAFKVTTPFDLRLLHSLESSTTDGGSA